MKSREIADRFGSSVLHHVGWFTLDLDRSLDFWTKVMGFSAAPVQVRRQSWIGKFLGEEGAEVGIAHLFGHGGQIEFIQFDKPERLVEQPDCRFKASHVCLKVRDLEGLCEDIVADGGSLKGEIY